MFQQTRDLLFLHSTFRQGMHDLKVWPEVNDDVGMMTKVSKPNEECSEQMSCLSKLTKKHRKGHMLKVDWLDRLTFREIEMINEVRCCTSLKLLNCLRT